jgi:hypothetical protein
MPMKIVTPRPEPATTDRDTSHETKYGTQAMNVIKKVTANL